MTANKTTMTPAEVRSGIQYCVPTLLARYEAQGNVRGWTAQDAASIYGAAFIAAELADPVWHQADWRSSGDLAKAATSATWHHGRERAEHLLRSLIG